MKIYTRKEIIKILKPSPEWKGFDKWVYTKKETNLKYMLFKLYTAWDMVEDFHRPTFIKLAKQIKNAPVSELPKNKMNNLFKIKNGYNDKIIKIPAFYFKDLKKYWPEDFPANDLIADEDYIAEDGNTRLTAYALKFLENHSIGKIPVELYLGRKEIINNSL